MALDKQTINVLRELHSQLEDLRDLKYWISAPPLAAAFFGGRPAWEEPFKRLKKLIERRWDHIARGLAECDERFRQRSTWLEMVNPRRDLFQRGQIIAAAEVVENVILDHELDEQLADTDTSTRQTDATGEQRASEDNQERLGGIPPLDMESDEWLSAVAVAHAEKGSGKIGYLKMARSNERCQCRADDDSCGIDAKGRMWRRDPAKVQFIWYFKPTIHQMSGEDNK